MISIFKKDLLQIQILEDKRMLGEKAAADAGSVILQLLKEKENINIIFAAAPSQSSFLSSLKQNNAIPWNRINAFHMDEYVGLPASAPQLFSNFLNDAIFDSVPFRSIHYMDGSANDTSKAITGYTSLILQNPPDIVFMGIGENTHLAFNEPYQADFNDPEIIKIVKLDAVCRQQQVNDGCFNSLDDVPTTAITITIPVLLSARYIFCMVPGASKANAVMNTLIQDISNQYPSTILRTHTNAVLYLDKQSASLLKTT